MVYICYIPEVLQHFQGLLSERSPSLFRMRDYNIENTLLAILILFTLIRIIFGWN